MTDTPTPEGVTPEQVAAMCRTMRDRPYRLASETEEEASLRRIKERADAADMLEALAADLAAQKARADALERERDAFRAVLEGARYGDIDGIAKNTPDQSRALGEVVMQLTLAKEARAEAAKARVAKLVEALDSLLDAITAENEHRDRALTITGPTANLKWLIEACEEARAVIAEVQG